MTLHKVDNFESDVVDLVAKIAPWCAPIPTAYLVGRATVVHLAWPEPIGILSAAVIESLGIATCATALDLYQFNQNRRKSDPPAPFWLSVLLVSLYFAVAVILTVVLDTQPSWSAFAPAIFPVLSLAGVTVISLRKDYQKRLRQIADEKAERKAERQASKDPSRHKKQEPSKPNMSSEMTNTQLLDISLDRLQAGRKAKLENRIDKLLDIYRNSPELRISDAARLLNVSRQTVYSYIDQLEQSGKIHRNGHGIEVLK